MNRKLIAIPLIILALFTFFSTPCKAQGTDETLVRIETPTFTKISHNPNYLYIPMDFNQSEATKQIEHISVRDIISVSLVYSQYRASDRFNQLALNESRTLELMKLIPELKNNKSVKWYWVAQTGCHSPSECKTYFHGFEIRLKSKEDKSLTSIANSQLDYYTNIHLSKAKYSKHLDSLTKTRPSSVIEQCDTSYIEYNKIKNRTGMFKPKQYNSKKQLIRLWNKSLDKEVSRFSLYISDKNKLKEIEGMEQDLAKQLFKEMRKYYYISSSRMDRERLHTHFNILLDRNFRGKIKNYTIVATPVDQDKNPLDMPAYSMDYRRKITCTLIDTSVEGIYTNYIQYDNVITEVFDRNTQWKKCLVATDVTGSMYPYLGQFLAWHKLNLNRDGQNFDFVFFNDGDNMRDAWKIKGKVGGTYYIHSKRYEDIRGQCIRAQNRGGGGDGPENNIEAIIHGINENPNVKEVILIADNWATPRDLSLLKQVEIPIHVILCGATAGINVEYLNMVRENGGTLHTMEDDLLELAKVNEGQLVTIGSQSFIIRKGKFELLGSKTRTDLVESF